MNLVRRIDVDKLFALISVKNIVLIWDKNFVVEKETKIVQNFGVIDYKVLILIVMKVVVDFINRLI